MIAFLFLCLFIGLPIGLSFYNYKRYKKIKSDYELLKSNMHIGVSITKSINNSKEVDDLKNKLSDLQKKYDNLRNYVNNKELLKRETPHVVSYLYTNIKFSVQDIVNKKDEFLSWRSAGSRLELKIDKDIVGEVDYEPKCNYVNKGWNGPEIIEANAQCCTVNVGGAYLQFRAPSKGIVYYQEKNNLRAGDIVLSIETDSDKIDLFEKQQIKNKLLQKKRKQDLEKMALQELMDEGEIFPEANKRPPIPKEVVDAVWNRDGGKCVYCGSTENLHLDHIIPFSKGGNTSVENLQLLCQKCNLQKSNKIG